MPDNLLIELQELLSRELAFYKALRLMVSHALEAIVIDQDMEELLKILNRKEAVLMQLEALPSQWKSLLEREAIQAERGSTAFWAQLSALAGKDSVSELKPLLDEVTAAADDLVKAEQESQKQLQKHLDSLRTKLSTLNRGERAAAGYAKMGGAYLDPR